MRIWVWKLVLSASTHLLRQPVLQDRCSRMYHSDRRLFPLRWVARKPPMRQIPILVFIYQHLLHQYMRQQAMQQE